jgi:pimeloyl-ACP methyl ester carboxylesterase
MGLYSELRRRHVFKVAAAYLVVAWVVIQVAGAIRAPMSLPEWFEPVVLGLLILGFPVALVLAWAFDLKPASDVPAGDASAVSGAGQARGLATSALVLIALTGISGAAWWFAGADERQALTEGIAELDQHISLGEWEAAYRAARNLENVIPGSPQLSERRSKFSWLTTLESEPTGASVYRRPYRAGPDDWELLGNTPLEGIRVPFGMSVLRVELDGYEPVLQVIGGSLIITEALSTVYYDSKSGNLAPELIRLDPDGSLPEGMVRVPGWSQSIDGETVTFNDFFIDRFEVTNREYNEFIEAGAYDQREYWEHAIVGEDGEIPWEQAMSSFVDTTGRPGPSTWVAGYFPEGKGDHPVSGISWYEAAAYARFRARQLPTYHHWVRAYAPAAFSVMLPESNLASDDTVPVGTTRSISWAGSFDMSGNVREWLFNEGSDRRYALGGAWIENSYWATNLNTVQIPLDRSPGNGLRLALIRDEPDAIAAARAPIPATEARRDIEVAAQVSDEVFEAYSINFEYDRSPLNAEVSDVGADDLMVHELVEIDAAYPSPRLPIHLLLPNNAIPPFQVIVYWPGSIVQSLARYEDFKTQLDFVLKSGRAFAFPGYYTTFGRRESGANPEPTGTAALRSDVIRMIKDLRRTVDYLESRPDIDPEKIALYGNSWGARYSMIGLAVESRFQAGILYTPVINAQPRPDIDNATYLTRITQPVLMISGEYDPFVPLEDSRAAYELIGTIARDKRLVVAPSGHFAPYNLLVKESLAWYDKYLGSPTRR